MKDDTYLNLFDKSIIKSTNTEFYAAMGKIHYNLLKSQIINKKMSHKLFSPMIRIANDYLNHQNVKIAYKNKSIRKLRKKVRESRGLLIIHNFKFKMMRN